MKKIIVIVATCISIILILFILVKLSNPMGNTVEKPIMDSKYNYILLNRDYKEDIKQILDEVNNKDYQKLNTYIEDLLTDLEQLNPDVKSDYYKYYIQYNQILPYEKFLSSHKNLASRILQNLKIKLDKGTVTEIDIQPCLKYIIFKKYSCYFRKYWFCLPYLRFSNDLYVKYNIDIDSYLSFEENSNNIFQLIPEPYVNEEEVYFSISNKVAEKILTNMPSNTNITDVEAYSFSSLIIKAQTDEYTLIYTIID